MENPLPQPPGKSHDEAVTHALVVARLRALRTHLLALHKVLLDTERERYELDHGRIDGPHAALQLVMRDPFFQWLHPLLAMIVQVDERIADKAPITANAAEVFLDQARDLLQRNGDPAFTVEYHRALQESPDVVVAHAAVVKVLVNDPGAGSAG